MARYTVSGKKGNGNLGHGKRATEKWATGKKGQRKFGQPPYVKSAMVKRQPAPGKNGYRYGKLGNLTIIFTYRRKVS